MVIPYRTAKFKSANMFAMTQYFQIYSIHITKRYHHISLHKFLLFLFQEAEVAELEEKIKELKEQREAYIAKKSKLEAERKECHEKGKQVDNEVEAITNNVEELRVCVCTRIIISFIKSTILFTCALLPPSPSFCLLSLSSPCRVHFRGVGGAFVPLPNCIAIGFPYL